MEEEIYTEDERELLELLKWTIEVTTNYPHPTEKDKKTAEENIKGYKDVEHLVVSMANGRTKTLKGIEEQKYRHLNDYEDVKCSNCNFIAALKPIGEKVGDHGFKYAVYVCPKCGNEFSQNLPIFSEDRIKAGEILLKLMRKKKAPYEAIKALEDSIERLKITTKDVEVKTAELLKLYADHAEYVSDNIVRFTTYKQNVLSGSQDTSVN